MISFADYLAEFQEEPGYFDYAQVGPLSQRVVTELSVQVGVLSRSRFGSLEHLNTQAARVREAIAALTAFRSDQIVFQPNSSVALMSTLFGVDGGVLLSATDFPSSAFAAVRSAQAMGRLTPIWLATEQGRVTPEAIREQLTSTITTVVTGQVDFHSGFRVDLAGIRDVIGDRLLIVNAAQGFGLLDEDFAAADVVVSNGFKWARAGYDTGFLALNDRALERITPVISGFHEGDLSAPLDEVPVPARSAESFLMGPPNPIAQARLSAALELLAEVGLETVSKVTLDNAARVLELADQFGVPVLTPREETARAGIVTLAPETQRVAQLAAALYNNGITATIHQDSIRLSVHATTGEESFEQLRLGLVSYARVAGAGG